MVAEFFDRKRIERIFLGILGQMSKMKVSQASQDADFDIVEG